MLQNAELKGIDPVWLDKERTRFAWGPYRPWQEDPDLGQSANTSPSALPLCELHNAHLDRSEGTAGNDRS
jgi:hypothetical protein